MEYKSRFGISELIQSGILITLLTCAYSLGQMIQRWDMKHEDHEKRITKLEDHRAGS